MHQNNFTIYQAIKYHIELIEAMEYSLITYKYEENELVARLTFLNDDFKKGFYHYITRLLLENQKALTLEIKAFLKKYNKKIIYEMYNDKNHHNRVIYNRDLYQAYITSNHIINLLLNESKIKETLENSLIDLFNISNKYFQLAYLFNNLNLYISSKTSIFSDNLIYTLNQEDRLLMLSLLTSFETDIEKKELLNETINLISEKSKFNEDKAYDLLNEVSVAYSQQEHNLYTNFESFSLLLEKEIEKLHN